MGIQKFHSWLKQNYYSAIYEFNNYSYDHIYIDLNFILHRIISYVSTEDELYKRLEYKLTSIISNNIPRKSINLAADGSATYAKILLQKKLTINMVFFC